MIPENEAKQVSGDTINKVAALFGNFLMSLYEYCNISEKQERIIEECAKILVLIQETQLPNEIEWNDSTETPEHIMFIIDTMSAWAIMKIDDKSDSTVNERVQKYNEMAGKTLDDAYSAYGLITDDQLNQKDRSEFTVDATISAIDGHMTMLEKLVNEDCMKGLRAMQPLIDRYGSV